MPETAPRRAVHRQCHRRRDRRCRRRLPERRGPGQGRDAADRRRRGRAALRPHGAGARGQRRIGRQHRGGARRARRTRRLHRPGRATTSSARFYTPRHPRLGVEFDHRRGATSASRPRARMILVTPDGQRTMNTFLGAAQMLPASALDAGADRGGGDPLPRRLSVGPGGAARRDGAGDRGRARGAGARSPSPCRTASASTATATDFNALIDERPDRHPVRQRSRDRCAGRTTTTSTARSPRSRAKVPTAGRDAQRARRARAFAAASAPTVAGRADRRGWSTRPARATCSRRASSPARRAGSGLEHSLRLGAICAAEVIQHYGARPEADLRALAGVDLLV